jgi:type I restriction enzyme M protein
MSDDAKLFVSTLRKLRERVGNGYLRETLGWREERYWRVHGSLLEQGKIVRGRGRGGSVGLQ